MTVFYLFGQMALAVALIGAIVLGSLILRKIGRRSKNKRAIYIAGAFGGLVSVIPSILLGIQTGALLANLPSQARFFLTFAVGSVTTTACIVAAIVFCASVVAKKESRGSRFHDPNSSFHPTPRTERRG